MALTRSFKETIQQRAKTDKVFRRALLKEAVACFLVGDVAVGKSMLRDFINATSGFDAVAEALQKSPKSIMRMLSKQGNPTADNIFSMLAVLQHKEKCTLRVS